MRHYGYAVDQEIGILFRFEKKPHWTKARKKFAIPGDTEDITIETFKCDKLTRLDEEGMTLWQWTAKLQDYIAQRGVDGAIVGARIGGKWRGGSTRSSVSVTSDGFGDQVDIGSDTSDETCWTESVGGGEMADIERARERVRMKELELDLARERLRVKELEFVLERRGKCDDVGGGAEDSFVCGTDIGEGDVIDWMGMLNIEGLMEFE